MQFNIKHRDGPARIGEIVIDGNKVISPNILFVNTDRFKAPYFADLIIYKNIWLIDAYFRMIK